MKRASGGNDGIGGVPGIRLKLMAAVLLDGQGCPVALAYAALICSTLRYQSAASARSRPESSMLSAIKASSVFTLPKYVIASELFGSVSSERRKFAALSSTSGPTLARRDRRVSSSARGRGNPGVERMS